MSEGRLVEVPILELHNHGGRVIDRVEAGEKITVTKDGRRVAELRPLGRRARSASVLIEPWSRLPEVDPQNLLVTDDPAPARER